MNAGMLGDQKQGRAGNASLALGRVIARLTHEEALAGQWPLFPESSAHP